MMPKRLLIAWVILLILIGIQCRKNTTISDELMGIWTATSLKYKGCFFELRTNSITIKPQEGEPNSFAITNIIRKKKSKEEWTRYTIYYVDQGGKEYEFPILYHPERNGVIRFKNQLDIVWTRESR